MEVVQDKQVKFLTQAGQMQNLPIYPRRLILKSSQIVFLTNKDGRHPCNSSLNTHLKVNWKTNLCIGQKTSMSEKKIDVIVSTSEIICLAHISLLQATRISNKSDPPRIVSFNGSMNHKKFRI
ncbi:hypothetical protein IGI04_039495 [Brassica rapa subsp. trilocularis]|uniref:Uncharacterized protein n=1 Tax=Brassica rapa subsp. trilocularis TaxID=1813537 RepID=A0ABQ7KL13_BRACM|nr:hypothetical protein IGI04_039495 [Brassica rapa subsp. trilocularis]